MGHTRLGPSWSLPPGVHIQVGDEHDTRHKGDLNSNLQIREDDKEEVDLKDERNFSWRRMRMMAFQKDGIPETMAWRHETITSARTI